LKYLTPNLLLGAMDYFYLVQSLPEDRLVIVDSQLGLVPIITWSFRILGLTVLVKDSPDGDVVFGNSGNPQVIIKWSLKSISDLKPALKSDTRSRQPSPSVPTIYLLDAQMHILLKSEQQDQRGTRIQGLECHRLRGYGTTFLQRLFNESSLVDDDDPIFAEAANFATAFARLISRSMRRIPHPPSDHTP